ncbi:histidine kinase [Streptomyces sodiiphilus]|uniref:Histidine kinase n=1 Tax=Streptomyces sodiiphilus TaxID=226217 RepID=A0ABN2PL86_9ACTN
MRAGGWDWLHRYRRSSQRARVHQYTRTVLYSFVLVEAALVVLWAVALPAGTPLWVRAVIAATGTGHVALMLLLSREGLRHYLGRGPRPDRLLAAGFVMTLLGTGMAVAMLAGGLVPRDASVVAAWMPLFFAGPALLALPVGQGSALAAVPVAAAWAGAVAAGLPADGHLVLLLTLVLGGAAFGLSYRCSGWTLKVVDELDAARETQARLAVAEERLRFGRDLHDVLGRNLSVIALKSELAVQLAQRGSDAALTQMTEVQRIARESQREMREVVRGYRAADLTAELAGARGVLEAAGIECRIENLGGHALPAQAQSALAWVVREGTTNVLRHAEAGRCVIRLRPAGPDAGEGAGAVLTMENDGVPDGCGAAGDGGGAGLAGLRERLAALGGSLTAVPAAGGRFRLTAQVRTEENG